MKCMNCGADYNIEESCCPYCLTPNTYGDELEDAKEDALDTYDEIKEKYMPKIKKEITNKILNRILITEVILFGLIILGSILIITFSSATNSLYVNFNKGKLEAQLREAYEEENFDKLDYILSKKDLLKNSEYSGYVQMKFIYYDYIRFCEERASFYNASTNVFYDLNDVQILLSCINRVMNPPDYKTTSLDEKNAEYSSKYMAEAYAFSIGSLKMSQEEFEVLKEKHISSDKLEKLANSICERRPWNE